MKSMAELPVGVCSCLLEPGEDDLPALSKFVINCPICILRHAGAADLAKLMVRTTPHYELSVLFTFSYYADVENNCQVFHICLPMEDDVGEVTDVLQWSFICGNGTIFDQQTLTCNHPADAFPCEEAESLYFTVEFGKIPEEK